MVIDGIEIVVQNGKAKLSARSYNATNASMYRPGSAQREGALRAQAKANRILSSLNSTGSYTNSAGMKTTLVKGSDILKYGQWKQEAVPGTEAWETQQRIAAAGGLKALQAGSIIDGEMGIGAMIDYVMEEAQIIGDEIMEEAQGYLDSVAEATANIGQAIINVFTN